MSGAIGGRGAAGPQGPAGPSGQSATVQVGQVTAQAAVDPAVTIVNTGTASSAVLDFSFELPKGDKGDTGNTGSQGPQGPVGPSPVFSQPAASSLPAGSQPTVSAVGDGTSASPLALTFGIPAGPSGAPGAPPVFGTPLTGQPGTAVQLTGSGTALDPLILTVPKGADGAQGPQGPPAEVSGTLVTGADFALEAQDNALQLTIPEILTHFSTSSGSTSSSSTNFPLPAGDVFEVTWGNPVTANGSGSPSSFKKTTATYTAGTLKATITSASQLLWNGVPILSAQDTASLSTTTYRSFSLGFSSTVPSSYLYYGTLTHDAQPTLSGHSVSRPSFTVNTNLPAGAYNVQLTYQWKLFLAYSTDWDSYALFADPNYWVSSSSVYNIYSTFTVNTSASSNGAGVLTVAAHNVKPPTLTLNNIGSGVTPSASGTTINCRYLHMGLTPTYQASVYLTGLCVLQAIRTTS